MEVKQYIKNFSEITVNKICQKLGFPVSNILTGKASQERMIAVKEEIESELAKLYIKGDKNE